MNNVGKKPRSSYFM